MLDIPELDLSDLMKEYDSYDRTGKEFCARYVISVATTK